MYSFSSLFLSVLMLSVCVGVSEGVVTHWQGTWRLLVQQVNKFSLHTKPLHTLHSTFGKPCNRVNGRLN